eukprot:scaffold67056_cov18-Tisochrysis_lutea.AAC.1
MAQGEHKREDSKENPFELWVQVGADCAGALTDAGAHGLAARTRGQSARASFYHCRRGGSKIISGTSVNKSQVTCPWIKTRTRGRKVTEIGMSEAAKRREAWLNPERNRWLALAHGECAEVSKQGSPCECPDADR